jgi:hypothetical protein
MSWEHPVCRRVNDFIQGPMQLSNGAHNDQFDAMTQALLHQVPTP